MSATNESQALFMCPPERIWAVLCGEKFFSRWYGYPEPLELIEIDPGFSVGAKLTFKNRRSFA